MTTTDLAATHPLEIAPADVARLTRPGREYRVHQLIERAHELLDYAETVPTDGKPVAATAVLYSGGNDSTTLAHLFRGRATHAIHANTGIGVEETRDFVRRTAPAFGYEYIEKHAPTTYRDLVLAHRAGFPGPGQHFKMYQRLKERCLDAARHDLGVHNSRSKRAVYIAGRRRSESQRRANVVLHERDGSVVWVSPMAEWTKLDLNTYRLMFPDVPRNPVTEKLHMSGECLCGAFAKPGEIDEIGFWFPEVRAEIEGIEAELVGRDDIPAHRRYWGWGAHRGEAAGSWRVGRLCSSCEAPDGGVTVVAA